MQERTIKMKYPIKVIYVYGGIMGYGGIEKFIIENYRRFDSKKIQVDFIVHGFEKGIFDDEIILNDSKIFQVPIKSKNPLGNYVQLKKIFEREEYCVVHSHMDAMNGLVLKIASDSGIPIRISHSHSIDHLTKNIFKRSINNFTKTKIRKYSTHFLACSKEAGIWLYGKESWQDNKVKIIPNAINIKKYTFNTLDRVQTKKHYRLDDELVVGHVGNFTNPKNHEFLLEVFKEICYIHSNSKLILVGEGPLKEKIENKISELKLKNKVIFTGNSSNIPSLLSTMDIFIFPSLFEGLGISLIEAQANGLPCLVSSTVPNEVGVTDLVYFENLNKTPQKWAKKAIEIYLSSTERSEHYTQLTEAGYNIDISSKNLEKYYLDLVKGIK